MPGPARVKLPGDTRHKTLVPMSDQTETRGWELECSYSPHPLDDAEHDITAPRSNWAAIVVCVAVAALLIATYLFGQTLVPPAVSFHVTPPQPVLQYVYVPDVKIQKVFVPAETKIDPMQVRVDDPLHACGRLPNCPDGRVCIIDRECKITIR